MRNKTGGLLQRIRKAGLALSAAALLSAGCVTQPYKTSFQCPGTYEGMCETLDDAYFDSVHGIDPKKFDEKWAEKEKQWEEKNKKLIEARKKAASPERHDKGEIEYRKRLFKELSSLLAEPVKPLVAPPKVVRVLVLSSLARDTGRKTIFVSPRYVYFMLDDPHWLLHGQPTVVPFDPGNPMINREEK